MSGFPICGIIPPLVTPLTARAQLDRHALECVLDHVMEGGVHGVFLLGTTGEGPSLSSLMQREVISAACRHVAGRLPVLVGITDSSLDESLDLARHAAEQGADAVVAAPPFYFPIHQADLWAWFVRLARECPLPVFLYNMPSHTKVAFEAETVRRLMQEPNIHGIKDSSAQMLYFNELLLMGADRPEFVFLTGPEELLAEGILMGGHGGVCGGANLVPHWYVELYEAAVAGDLRQVLMLQQRVMRLSTRLYRVGPPPTGFMTGIKAALELMGLCQAHLAAPLQSLPKSQLAEINQHLIDLGILEEHALKHSAPKTSAS